MGMNFFQRRKILRRLNTLDVTPVRCCGHEIDGDSHVIVVVPKFRKEWINEFFLGRKPRNFRVKLDKSGTAIWLLINGSRTVDEICKELVQQLGDEVQPVEERVSKFISVLYEQRYITFKELSEKNII
jgi:hypothetical protein